MKTFPARSPTLFLAAALAFTACAPLVPRQIPFREADFAATSGRGTGSVTGQVFIMKGVSSIVGVDETPLLLPVNAYTDEVIQKKYIAGRNLAQGDPRYYQHLRTTQADGMGYFAFHGIPPGNYYVASGVEWSHWIWNTDQDGNLYKITIAYRIPLFARVSVQNGQTARVTDWTKGKSKQL